MIKIFWPIVDSLPRYSMYLNSFPEAVYPFLLCLQVTQTRVALALRCPDFWMSHKFDRPLWSRALDNKRVGRWELKWFWPFQELHQESILHPRYRKIHGWIKIISERHDIGFYSLQTFKTPVKIIDIEYCIVYNTKKNIFLETGDDFIYCRFLKIHRLRRFPSKLVPHMLSQLANLEIKYPPGLLQIHFKNSGNVWLLLEAIVKKNYCLDNYSFLAWFTYRVDIILFWSVFKFIKFPKLDLTLPKIFSVHRWY